MKAKIKQTGEIIEVEKIIEYSEIPGTPYGSDYEYYKDVDNKKSYNEDELDFINIYPDWQQIRNDKPRSWEEFCRKYPVKGGEAFIDIYGWIGVRNTDCEDNLRASKNWCVSKEEAEAFLALMQLRQLRKAWVGDWEQPNSNPVAGIFYSPSKEKLIVFYGVSKALITLSFPSTKMATDFLNCFKDLCKTAKILL